MMDAPIFRTESLLEIVERVEAALAVSDTVTFCVLDPDLGRGRYAGELVDGCVHRPWRVWLDLAERLGARMATPQAGPPPFVRVRLERLPPEAAPEPGDATEKYGAGSRFSRIDKREDPGLLLDLRDALERVHLGPAPRVLDLGVNTGDELALLMSLARRLRDEATFVGIDHSPSALAAARGRFGENVELLEADVRALGSLGLGRFDLVLSIGTLQSPGADGPEVLRRVVQDHLTPTGAVIFGFPNCRYQGGELVHGARTRNFRHPELGLLAKDVAFNRRYLQQRHRKVTSRASTTCSSPRPYPLQTPA